MVSTVETFLLPLIILTTCLPLYSSLNITGMSVESQVTAPATTSLSCITEKDKENDQFQSLQWSKLINGKWEVFKKIPNTPQGNKNTTVEEPMELKKLEDLAESETEDVVFTKSSLSTAGLYKCSITSTLGRDEKVMELRVLYKPDEASSPAIYYLVKDDNIKVTCSAPASYPATALQFFINNELPADGEFRYLHPLTVTNTSYGESVELPMNVAELKIRATQRYVLNGILQIVCTATLSNIYHKSVQLDIPYDGPIYGNKCLTGPMIALIVVAILVSIVIITGIVWFVLRKKKINSLNKVAELFNKQKSVLVDKE